MDCPLPETPKLEAQLKPVVSLHLEQKEVHDANTQRLARLMESYNEFVALVSQKFIYYDHLVTTWEQKVSAP